MEIFYSIKTLHTFFIKDPVTFIITLLVLLSLLVIIIIFNWKKIHNKFLSGYDQKIPDINASKNTELDELRKNILEEDTDNLLDKLEAKSFTATAESIALGLLVERSLTPIQKDKLFNIIRRNTDPPKTDQEQEQEDELFKKNALSKEIKGIIKGILFSLVLILIVFLAKIFQNYHHLHRKPSPHTNQAPLPSQRERNDLSLPPVIHQ